MSELIQKTWSSYAGDDIAPVAQLEDMCWAPWLAASPNSLAGRAEVFPNGQLCITSEQGLLATLSVNQIMWDGDPNSLPSWDDVAGDPTTYEGTFVSDGNTLCLMSMNVHPLGRGQQLPKLLISSLLQYAEAKGVQHVIGSFRPSAYSQAVLEAVNAGAEPPIFSEYCCTTDQNGNLVDPWLRALSRNGMQPLAIDPAAMRIPVTAEEFTLLRQPHWQQITINGAAAWWCGETGFFYPQPDGSYLYQESNVWGVLYEASVK